LPLRFYRFYFKNHGHTVAAEVLECAADSDAVETAKRLLSSSPYTSLEVWQRTRKVGVWRSRLLRS
jgi:hypothetical protein